MSILSRFRKPGGFQQLLTLMETCDPAKRKTLFHLLSSEDPGWAHLIKIKALSFERISSWPEEVLMEITPHLADPILIIAVQMSENWLKGLPEMKAREIKKLAQSTPFDAQEKQSASIKIIQTVRELAASGKICFSDFDATLEIDTKLAS